MKAVEMNNKFLAVADELKMRRRVDMEMLDECVWLSTCGYRNEPSHEEIKAALLEWFPEPKQSGAWLTPIRNFPAWLD